MRRLVKVKNWLRTEIWNWYMECFFDNLVFIGSWYTPLFNLKRLRVKVYVMLCTNHAVCPDKVEMLYSKICWYFFHKHTHMQQKADSDDSNLVREVRYANALCCPVLRGEICQYLPTRLSLTTYNTLQDQVRYANACPQASTGDRLDALICSAVPQFVVSSCHPLALSAVLILCNMYYVTMMWHFSCSSMCLTLHMVQHIGVVISLR